MKYHFIGDRGVSMRGLKKYMDHLGDTTTGSDLKSGGHNAKNITSDIDVVVRTSAVNPGSEGWKEVEEAKRLGIKVIKRSELLGEITKDKQLIAISGTHGKTTVTTMIGLILIEAGMDPTVLVGENVKEFENDVIKIGKSDWFVAEACEYDHSFLDLSPKILIITNIDEEHLDTFPGGLSEIKETFLKLANQVPDDGTIIACGDDRNVTEILAKKKTHAKVIVYGKNSENYHDLGFDLNIPGMHNRLNALSAVALADNLNIDRKISQKVLRAFSGAKRRFEHLGQYNGAVLIDDYGHHPTEIKATIQALSEQYPDKKKLVIFWPHQYKRIKPLLNKFGEAFRGVDKVILKPIYLVPGRDQKLDVSSSDLVKLINENEHKEIAEVMDGDEKIVSYLKNNIDQHWAVLTIGIPPVYKVIGQLLTK